MSHDLQGRQYATKEDIVEGSFVLVDGGFTCMSEGEIKKIKILDGDLCTDCDCGTHSLHSQLDKTETFYIGLYPCKMTS